MAKLRWVVVVLLFTALTGLAVVVWRRDQLEGVSWLVGVAGGYLAIAAIVVPWARRYPGAGAGSEVDGAHDTDDPDATTVTRLHHRAVTAVRRQYAAEDEAIGIDRSPRLALRWSVAPPGAADHWANMTGGSWLAAADLVGSGVDVTDTYRRVPSGRLVLIAPGGYGKSTLLHQLARTLLEQATGSQPDSRPQPLPLLVNLRSWDAATVSFEDWLIDEVGRSYPFLATRRFRRRTTSAAVLVEAGLVLPLLDGFDEMASALRLAALNALPAGVPLVLASRDKDYRSAVKRARPLARAAVIAVNEPTTEDLYGYLRLSGRIDDAGRSAWEDTISLLGASPSTAARRRLLAVLRVPLMASLAAVAFGSPDTDPAELTRRRFATRQDVEQYLLETMLTSAYTRPVRSRALPTARWDGRGRDARRWLAQLARVIDRSGADRFTWWRLRDEVPTSARRLIMGVSVGVPAALTLGTVASVTGGPPAVAASMALLQSYVTFALADAVRARFRRDPHRIGFHLRGRWRQVGVSVLGGLGAGVCAGIIVGRYAGPLAVVAMGSSVGVSTALVPLLTREMDLTVVPTPRVSIDLARRAALAPALFIATASGLSTAWRYATVGGVTASGITPGTAQSVIGGAGVFVTAACGTVLVLSAWGDWLKFRVWYCGRGRLPWRLVDFLDDACRRGILRQAGASYEFRHQRIKERLLEQPEPGAS